jgi:hypothetical protein
MTELTMPVLSASPWQLQRSGLSWLRRSGESLAAGEPMASCYLRLFESSSSDNSMPLRDERNDLQVVLAPTEPCTVTLREALSKGAYQALVEASDWSPGESIADASSLRGSGVLSALLLAGRRGFENGEGRGDLLAGWHERVRGYWQGGGSEGGFGTVLALGTCEQNAVFRGDDRAFLSWFARAPGPAQIISVSDDRCVHSSAVVLQHLRRTPAEAAAITQAVYAWIGERMGGVDATMFPSFQAEASRGTLHGRWPAAQDILYAMHLLAESVGTSPILERSEAITSRGIIELEPPKAIAMSLGSEFSPHFRHRKTGWIISIHGFRFGPFVGPGFAEWLRRDFEQLNRSVEDSQRDFTALADEVKARTGASFLVQNLISSDLRDRISNYAWLGEAFEESVPVRGNEANVMLSDLARSHNIALIDSDAMAAEHGITQVPDRFHASRELVELQRSEVHRVLQGLRVKGF